jgi:hypothetical protein
MEERKDYWQVSREFRNGDTDSHMVSSSFDDAYEEYCRTLKEMVGLPGERAVLYEVSSTKFVHVVFSATVGQ